MNDFSIIAKPGAYLADALPFFGKLSPQLQWWRAGLKPYFDKQANLWMSFWTSLKTQMETNQAPECFVLSRCCISSTALDELPRRLFATFPVLPSIIFH
ncbi:MAG: hypothetical protein EOP21_06245 [Hyphomicrobiales bacterium]|nr:MAG: hypothetical protein EOP21_06245 [Hyphomicrobiales bacterium]